MIGPDSPRSHFRRFFVGDGSVRLIKNSMSAPIWVGLNTIASGEVISSDSY